MKYLLVGCSATPTTSAECSDRTACRQSAAAIQFIAKGQICLHVNVGLRHSVLDVLLRPVAFRLQAGVSLINKDTCTYAESSDTMWVMQEWQTSVPVCSANFGMQPCRLFDNA